MQMVKIQALVENNSYRILVYIKKSYAFFEGEKYMNTAIDIILF